jgi:DNA-binding response OmpR family regulator
MENRVKILIVEDDLDINNLLFEIVKKEGYEVRQAFSGTEAKMCLEYEKYNLILLDLMLPGMTGEELVVHIREKSTCPIIVASAKMNQNTKVEVLNSGADDFISKPFDTVEVMARINAQLRRYMVFSENKEADRILEYKNLKLDLNEVKVMIEDKEIQLTAREFKILELLMSHPKKVFTRDNIFQHVWNDEFLGDDNTVNVHISNLRSKLAKVDSKTEYIQTVWGIGFKMQ